MRLLDTVIFQGHIFLQSNQADLGGHSKSYFHSYFGLSVRAKNPSAWASKLPEINKFFHITDSKVKEDKHNLKA